MNKPAKSDGEAQKPPADFAEPHQVVADHSLSNAEKVEALDALEQDARQLSEASSEGMGGGESNTLDDVLAAKNTLASLPLANAYEIVLQDLRSRQKRDATLDIRVLLSQAIAALDGLASSSIGPPSIAAMNAD